MASSSSVGQRSKCPDSNTTRNGANQTDAAAQFDRTAFNFEATDSRGPVGGDLVVVGAAPGKADSGEVQVEVSKTAGGVNKMHRQAANRQRDGASACEMDAESVQQLSGSRLPIETTITQTSHIDGSLDNRLAQCDPNGRQVSGDNHLNAVMPTAKSTNSAADNQLNLNVESANVESSPKDVDNQIFGRLS